MIVTGVAMSESAARSQPRQIAREQASVQALRRAHDDLLTSSASERATSAARGMALAAHLFPT
jgi:hypothetical protein